MPPGCGSAFRKPGGEISDRGHRYRAQRAIPCGPRRCALCGSKRFLVADHVDSDESNDDPANIRTLCKSCNTLLGIAAAKAGKGRRVNQMNPGEKRPANPKVVTREKAEAMQEKAIAFMDRIDADDPNDIADMSVEEYAEHKHLRLAENPGAETLSEYVSAAVQHQRGTHDAGGLTIHDTPPEVRSKFAKQIWALRRKHGTDRTRG